MASMNLSVHRATGPKLPPMEMVSKKRLTALATPLLWLCLFPNGVQTPFKI
ncbi:hypothetical protein Q31b_04510 [Novipirellula aureliae]|uniref:Uncharacterized protein n=1 Tax=Novipirellula aureliae TaxID=2527966 RepID=A0A5C6E904_9BACT|nr:hypothetical protein Q31b_04510 [Novipirellula aureliae]